MHAQIGSASPATRRASARAASTPGSAERHAAGMGQILELAGRQPRAFAGVVREPGDAKALPGPDGDQAHGDASKREAQGCARARRREEMERGYRRGAARPFTPIRRTTSTSSGGVAGP